MAGRPRKHSVEESLDRALHVFWKQGYEQTSMRDLTAALEVGPSSIYNTFGSKMGLYEAALARYVDRNGTHLFNALQATPLASAVEAFLQAAVTQYSRPDCPGGCAVMDAAPSPASACHPFVGELRDRTLDALRHRMAAADPEELPAGTTADGAARFVYMALQGLSSQARQGAPRTMLTEVAILAARPFQRP